MKKLIALATVVLFACAGVLNAQDAKVKKSEPASAKSEVAAKCDMKNCCIKKDGRVVYVKDGVEMALDQPLKLSNGFTVYPDGVYANETVGKRMMLMDGDAVDMQGNMQMAKPTGSEK